MAYVDAYVLPVKTDRIEDYREMEELSASVWKEHGALSYSSAIAEDVPDGTLTSLPMAVKLENDETVVVGWVTYTSREHRDEVNKKAMSDPRLKGMMDPATMPMDGKRLIYGGFRTLVDA